MSECVWLVNSDRNKEPEKERKKLVAEARMSSQSFRMVWPGATPSHSIVDEFCLASFVRNSTTLQ